MEKQICAEHCRNIRLQNKSVGYILKTSRRARKMRLAIYCDGRFVVTRPIGLSENIVERFIIQKANWILSKLEHFKQFKGSIFKNDRREYLKHKDDALKFVNERIDYLNKIYNFKFNKINIRNQKTRWGSCSKKGNLNFNYKIVLLPRRVSDYIIVHELCHLKEFNHSKNFWNLVAKAVPEYQKIKAEKLINFKLK